ncbi:MAG: GNAT family N-acetyltransferase [Coriobacteriia bacterium]|nr:GNAT family N-acetyltransferase [Coriobacteriia bacterium]MBN2822894.1 GNAT family N-acetyltransferase [Coriobacteriia bacterium]
MRRTLRIATGEDLAMVWSALRSTHIFEERAQLDDFFAEAPWRVRVTDVGEAVVLERWREHLAILSVRGLWCAEHRIAPLMKAVDEVATAQGYADLVSPVIPEAYADPYLQAGMRICQRIVTMRLDHIGQTSESAVNLWDGVRFRLADAADLAELIAVDILAFDPFWRADVPTIERYMQAGRVVVAQAADRLVGYTLATASRGDGVLGRLAVVPGYRGRGVGTALLQDAVEYLARCGARSVSLCTQEDNASSRSLYSRVGFAEVGAPSVFLAFCRTPNTSPIPDSREDMHVE